MESVCSGSRKEVDCSLEADRNLLKVAELSYRKASLCSFQVSNRGIKGTWNLS